jgi:DNA-binding NarL/FixJ family response regulator
LRTILNEYDDIELACVGDIAAAVSQHREFTPDVVLLNPSNGWVDSPELIRQVGGRDKTARVLLLVGDGSTPLDAHDLADGVVLVQAEPGVLVAAIRLVAAGYGVLLPAMSRAAPVQPAKRDGSGRTALAALTERELEVLRVLARGATNAEIARELALSVSTVKSHVQSVLTKLGLSNRARAVAISHQLGIAGPAPLPPGTIGH